MAQVKLKLNRPHTQQAQVKADARRYNVLTCGRRWGKTNLGVQIAIAAFLAGEPVGWFAPTYKYLDQAIDEIRTLLRPIGAAAAWHGQRKELRLGQGRIDFWSLERGDAGRGRKYKVVVIDESALARHLEAQWTHSISPTLADLQGSAWFLSTPRGHNYHHKLHMRAADNPELWASWQMPTISNPYIRPSEIERAQEELPADAFSQEFLAEFLADAANPFGIEAIRACIVEPQTGSVVAWGVDLAKSQDWTVVTGLDSTGNVVAWQRWQSDWKNTMARVSAMIGDVPACIDSTGVGDPIVEELQRTRRHVEGFKFSSQSKQMLMEGLAVAIQNRRITFPEGVIVDELETFLYEYGAHGVRYNAPAGLHDDCVDSLALAVRCLNNLPAGVRITVAGRDRQAEVWDTDPMDNDEIWVEV